MSKKFILIAIILIILFFVFFLRNKSGLMVNPAAAPLPSPAINQPISQPKEIKYDSSTDLKKELESVNPQVLDSDF